MLPPAAGPYRAEQLTTVSALIHRRWTDPQFVASVAELAESPLAKGDSNVAATIRRVKRRVDRKTKLPQRLVEELAHTTVLGQQAWERA